MEHTEPTERKTSFNPEALSFSPQPNAATLDEQHLVTDPAASHPVPPLTRVSNMPSFQTPLRASKNRRGASGEQALGSGATQSPATVLGGLGLEGQYVPSMPDLPGMALYQQLHPQTTRSSLIPLPYHILAQVGINSNANSPDVDELATSLGLPGAKQRTRTDIHAASTLKSAMKPTGHGHIERFSEVRPHRHDTPQGLHKDRAGRLLGRALDKPLTAVSLAQYLNTSQSDSSEETVRPSRTVRDPFTEYASPDRAQPQTRKIVRPPPGYVNETPRMVAVEEHVSTTPHPNQQQAAYMVPPDYFHRHAPDMQPYRRRSTTRRETRRHTRTKRSDQGPAPSAADIYPDDSDWIPRNAAPHLAHPSHGYSSPHRRLHVEDTTYWPTPAEVYMEQRSRPQAPVTEPYVPPTDEDMNALDDEVIALMDELPFLSVTTMIQYGALDLNSDDRPLTPGQENGKRYGLQHHGLGANSEWQGSSVTAGRSWENPEPFRVRPRDHVGWGGWEWAISRGWGDE